MLAVIVNPRSGGGRAGTAVGAVSARLRERGLEHHVATVTSLEHARELARAAAAAGETAVVLGGDGLVGAVAGALRRTEGVLGVLPGGRGNDFARMLGIPLDPVEACDVLATGVPRRLDLGDVGGRPFVGIASCGFDSDANRIANRARFVRGQLVYTYAGIRALARWRPAHFDLLLDGRPVSFTGYTVAVANSALYGGGMRIAPDASLEDGLFDIVTISAMPRLRFLRALPLVFKGEHTHEPTVTVARAREVEIRADRPFTLYADGEEIGELPVTVTIDPGAVRVLMPAASAMEIG
jgi:YegS/Rv2252/BmrU family lipid kinase